jgi:hypothetical protein
MPGDPCMTGAAGEQDLVDIEAARVEIESSCACADAPSPESYERCA